jgi:hypothetical protein
VLGAEEGRERPVAREEAIGRVYEAAVDRRRIADEPEALAGDQFAIGTVEEAFEAEADGHGRIDYSRPPREPRLK